MALGNKKLLTKGSPAGTLIIIGGREDKTGEMGILKEVVKHAGRRKIVIVTIASSVPNDLWLEYKKVFMSLGVKHIVHFSAEQHLDSFSAKRLSLFDEAHTIFFTGGDQLKITTKIGGTPVYERILEIFNNGGVIAGTSAGAAAMGKNMLVGSSKSESHKVGNWSMAPGLGFLEDIVVDQHFAQRGRIGRLLGALALNPGILGIGIDEDTAVVVQNESLKVIGRNAVYVIDGRFVSSTNVSQADAEKTMSMHDVRLHILASDEKFDLKNRKPSR